VIPRRVRVGARPCGVGALNARTRVREQVRAGSWEMRAWVPSSEADPARGGAQPSSEADLARGAGLSPRARRTPLGGASIPRARRTSLEGRPLCCTGGPRGPPGSWLCCVCVLGVRVDLCFAFFAGFKRVAPWLFRGPLWLSPTPHSHDKAPSPTSHPFATRRATTGPIRPTALWFGEDYSARRPYRVVPT
jgi:hypothetical protein